MNHQLPGPMSYAPESYNGEKDSYPKWMRGSLVAEDPKGDRWHVAAIEDIEDIDHADSHTATANLLAASYNAFDKAARELGVDATELACKVDLAALLKERTAMREALEACRVFVTPIEQRKGWNEYKQDAADRIRATVGGVV